MEPIARSAAARTAGSVVAAPLEQTLDGARPPDDAEDVDRHGGVRRPLPRMRSSSTGTIGRSQCPNGFHEPRALMPRFVAQPCQQRRAASDSPMRPSASTAAARTSSCAVVQRAEQRVDARRSRTSPSARPPRRAPTIGESSSDVVQPSMRPSARAASRRRGTTAPVVSRSATQDELGKDRAMPHAASRRVAASAPAPASRSGERPPAGGSAR